MKLVLTEFVTLDGVSQGPGSPTLTIRSRSG